jgi:hypothetical protein
VGQSNAGTGQTSAGLCGRNRDFQHLGISARHSAVWLYAAIRPRYDAGPKTAIRAGVFTWAVGVFLANLSNYPLGLFPTRLLVVSSIVALIEIVVATLVGAWVYKEEAGIAPVVHKAAA